ncbi:STAS domain-containing protein [Mycobacterium angelicum]|uniref:STAS domain-containing protein n=1 Tax=Mycobacterium angelicum TaxID=470074 RepID=A0A1X0A938_MYCAN|nr:STAS domain-containing protein [Mycobacterium angelicum]MCV7197664.1 STAS domain-containing protein [Mycobacterium angelicum]ORA26534.1 hypothetical protein BST12_01295 [Mycobacterium angelicum]
MLVTQSRQETRMADFTAQRSSSVAAVSAHGELDAANADELAEYVQRCITDREWLTLDLRGLEFIGTAGFSALHRINVVCSALGTHWAMIPSEAVSRLLRICDPDGILPVMEATVGSQAERLLQLVT